MHRRGLRRVLLVTALLLLAVCANAQTTSGSTSYDEFPVQIFHKNIGSINVAGVLVGKTVYLQVADVFQLCDIKADITEDRKRISGFYIDQDRKYVIDFATRTITYRDEQFKLSNSDVVETAVGYYLNTDVFDKVFQLKCAFDFGALVVELTSGEPLPAESEAAAAKNRQHLSSVGPAAFIPDRTLGVQRSWFSLGTIDYQAGTNVISGNPNAQSQYSLALGGQVFGGDFDASLSGSATIARVGSKINPIDWKAVPWQWRTGFDNSPLVSQVIIGKRANFSNLSLADSMIGIEFTNARQETQQSFSNYTISDRTEPNWTVELYINDALVNYTKADQTGYYKFVIPLSYGSTNVVLKFHGPYGEVRTQDVQIRIPYTFLPPGHIEYTATAGTSLYHPSIGSATGKLDMKFGISTFMTGGSGLFVERGALGQMQYRPYATTSIRLSSGLLLGGEYYYQTGFRSSLDITGPAGVSLEAEFDKPFGESRSSGLGAAIVDQRKLLMNLPLPWYLGSLRLSAQENPLNSDSGMVTFSAQTMISLFGLSFDLSGTYGMLRDRFAFRDYGSSATGSAGFSTMLFGRLMLHPSATIDYRQKRVTSTTVVLSELLGQLGTLSVTGSYSFQTAEKSIQAELRLNLPYFQLGLSGSGGTSAPYQGSGTISGSFGYDPHVGEFVASNHPQVRRAGMVVVPFLDRNNNGVWDDNEPIVKNFGFEQPPGQVVEESDGILRVTDMQPYKQYVVKTSTNDLENISWTPKFTSFEVTPPPNGFAFVQIPLMVSGQIEGYVYTVAADSGKTEAPLGGVRIKLRHNDPDDTTEVKLKDDLLTYSNGEYYFAELAPGKYKAFIDPKQLALFHYRCEPKELAFELRNLDEGDIVEDLNFTLHTDATPSPSDPKAMK